MRERVRERVCVRERDREIKRVRDRVCESESEREGETERVCMN